MFDGSDVHVLIAVTLDKGDAAIRLVLVAFLRIPFIFRYLRFFWRIQIFQPSRVFKVPSFLLSTPSRRVHLRGWTRDSMLIPLVL